MTPAHFSITVDADGIIRIKQEGFWTVDIAAKFIAEAAAEVETARSRGPVRLVIDARNFAIPSAEVGQKLAKFDHRVRREGDRMAMVVSSSLLKMQMKRQITRPGLEVFISENAANTWVTA